MAVQFGMQLVQFFQKVHQMFVQAVFHDLFHPAVVKLCMQFAGKPFGGTVAAGQAVRIFTGAVMPRGADTVVMQERAREVDGDDFTHGAHRALMARVKLTAEQARGLREEGEAAEAEAAKGAAPASGVPARGCGGAPSSDADSHTPKPLSRRASACRSRRRCTSATR